MSYDSITTIIGVKSLTDLVGVVLKRGDIYNYIEQTKTIKTEKEQITEIIEEITNLLRERRLARTTKAIEKRGQEEVGQEDIIEENKPLQDAITRFRVALEQAKSISPEEKKEFKAILAKIISERSKKIEEVENETDERSKKAMELYLHSKISGLKLVKDALNTALSGLQLHAFRAPMYAVMSALERAKKANLTFEKLELKGEILTPEQEQEKSKFAYIAKDLTIVATTEFVRSIAFQAKTEERKKMGVKVRTLDFVSALGQAIRILGLVGVGLDDIFSRDGALFDGNIIDRIERSSGQSINKIVEAYQNEGVLGVGEQIGRNYIENATNLLAPFKHIFKKEQEIEQAPGVSSKKEAFPQQSEVQVPNQEIIQIATVKKGEGIEHPLIRQLMDRPKDFGYKGDLNNPADIQSWAGQRAHQIAIENGFVGPQGEVRVNKADEIAAVLKPGVTPGATKVEIVNTSTMSKVSNIQDYTYYHPKSTETLSQEMPFDPHLHPEKVGEVPPVYYDKLDESHLKGIDVRGIEANPENLLPNEIKQDLANYFNLKESGASAKALAQQANEIIEHYHQQPWLGSDRDFKQTLTEIYQDKLNSAVNKQGIFSSLLENKRNSEIQNTLNDLMKVEGLAPDQRTAILHYLAGPDGVITPSDLHNLPSLQSADDRKSFLSRLVEPFFKTVESKTLPTPNDGWQPRTVYFEQPDGTWQSQIVEMQNLGDKVQVDLNHDGIPEEIFDPVAAMNIMKPEQVQQAIMEQAVAGYALQEETKHLQEQAGQNIEQLRQAKEMSMPHGENPLTPQTSESPFQKELARASVPPAKSPTDTKALEHTYIPKSKSQREQLTEQIIKDKFSRPPQYEPGGGNSGEGTAAAQPQEQIPLNPTQQAIQQELRKNAPIIPTQKVEPTINIGGGKKVEILPILNNIRGYENMSSDELQEVLRHSGYSPEVAKRITDAVIHSRGQLKK